MAENITINMENLTTEERNKLLGLIEKANRQPNKPFRKKDEAYWFINSNGVVSYAYENFTLEDSAHYSFGNYFNSKEEALFEVERLKVIRELKELAGGYKWKFSDDNYCINMEYYNRTAKRYTDSRKNKIVIMNCHLTLENNIYFPSVEAAQNAIDTIGEERLKKYYFCVE